MEIISFDWDKLFISCLFATTFFICFFFFHSNIFIMNICFFKKVLFLLKKLIKSLVFAILILIMNRKRLRTSKMTDTVESSINGDLGSLKMFEFYRIKCTKSSEVLTLKNEISNLTYRFSDFNSLSDSSPEKDQNLGQNLIIQYGVPKKRSGHRAVCNNDNMWIWGGFCPIREQNITEDDDENENVNISPLFPEVG